MMRNTYFPFLVALVFALLFTQCDDNLEDLIETNPSADLIQFNRSQSNQNKYIVLLNPEEKNRGNSQAIEKIGKGLLKKAGAPLQIDEIYDSSVQGFTTFLSPGQLKKLKRQGQVLNVEKDQVISLGKPSNTGKPSKGGSAPPQETPWGIARVNGGLTYTGNGVAWILDTGIDTDHPDLNVDKSRGFSAFTSGKDRSVDDGNGHGTHVAGTIAAKDDNQGVIGVAAGATVIPVKVLNSNGSGTYSGVIAGIDFVARNGKAGDVANMSLGGGYSKTVNDAVIAASNGGIIFCLAAGNDASNANYQSPASANGPYIYTVTAFNKNDYFAYFSNYGNPPVDYAAPGVSIKSTWKGGGYNTISGTSMATPHVAGLFLINNTRIDGQVYGDPDGTPDNILVNN